MPNVSHSLSTQFSYGTIDDAFPKVDPGHEPFHNKILVQLRLTREKTKGGVIISEGSREAEQWNTQVGKVLKIGPMAFKNRSNGEPWPEGAWFKVGDFVRIPKFRTDMFHIKMPNGDLALFALLNDLDISAKLTCDPREVMTFI